MQTSGADEAACRRALAEADDDVKVAIVTMLGDSDPASARLALRDGDGNVRSALAVLGDGTAS
jgi:N-acetylmuramic acid 6-phosphate etherase